MTALVDTNVLLDVLLNNPGFAVDAAAVWTAVETKRIEGLVAAVSLTNVHYIVRKRSGVQKAEEAVRLVQRVFTIIAVDAGVISDALASGNPDFEDAVQAAAALRSAATHVVTRDPRGFARSGLAVISPRNLIVALSPPSP